MSDSDHDLNPRALERESEQVLVVPCSGIGKAVGTVGREAAYAVIEDLRPLSTDTLCLSLLVMGDEVAQARVRESRCVTIDGCARECARKNVELALRVVAEMRAAGRPAGLVVTGPVDPHRPSGRAYLEQLLALRRALGLEDCAWFLSEELDQSPSDAMMDDLYHLADVLFLPSRDEGFGLPILEAAVNRLPIVCTALPALRELAGDAALYIGPDDDPAQVSARVLERVDADRLGQLAREVRSRYAWEVVYRERIAPLFALD